MTLTQTHIDANGIPHFAANPGGAPANVAVAVAKLGGKARFIGCIGDDLYGRMLRDTLLRYGVSAERLQTTDRANTTLAIVMVDERGERSFSFYRKPGADTMIDAQRAIRDIEGTGILHFGSVSLTDPACRDAVTAVVQAAKKAGALISYDPNYRAALWENEDDGCPVKVADTNGAGDTFFGAFLSWIAARSGLDGLTGDEISGYIRFANKAASITTSRPGAIPAMPVLQEVKDGLK